MNILYTFVLLFLCYLDRNKQNLVKCVNPNLKAQNQGTSSNPSPEYPNDLKIITEGSSEPNDTNKFDFLKSETNECYYVLKQGSHCTEVKVGQNSLWKGKPGDKYPSAISSSSNEIAINFSDKLLVFQNKNGTWEPDDPKSKSTNPSNTTGSSAQKSLKSSQHTESSSIQSTGSKSQPNEPQPTIHPESTSNTSTAIPQSTRFNLDENPDLKNRVVYLTKFQLIDIVTILINNLTNIDPEYNFKSDLNNYIQTSTSNKHPVTLDIDLRTDTDKIHVSNDLGFIYFTTKGNYAIKLVKKGEMIIWHTLNTTKYLRRVDVRDKILVLYKLDGTNKQVPIEQIKEVRDFESGVMTKQKVQDQSKVISIDISIRRAGSHFQYSRNPTNGVDMYSPIKPYVINRITNDNRLLWAALNDNYCMNVFVTRNSDGKTLVGLYFVDEDDEVIVDADQEPELNMVTLDLDHKEETQFINYTSEGCNKNHLFTPISPHFITRVKMGEVDVWKLDPDTFNGYPESVKLENNGTKVTIKFDETSLVYVKNDTGKCVEEQISCCGCDWKCVITFGLYKLCQDKCSN